MKRERFSSRLGFILISAGCAIGLGNVWRFPYIVGQYGGAIFVLIYLLFLVVLGAPIMTMEFAVGRASQKSCIKAFETIKPGKKYWRYTGYFQAAGNYVLMMFYTTVGGWMISYFVKMLRGDFQGISSQGVAHIFNQSLQDPVLQVFWMAFVIVLAFGICSLGLQNGVEKITKVMMSSLFVIIFILVIRSLTLSGGQEGLMFYLVPNLQSIQKYGLLEVVFAAMGQAFFTLSLGIGAIAIFGSYIDKSRRLLGETMSVCTLDTLVALLSGLIIFPACFAFGVNPESGPGLVFITLPSIFNEMWLGQLWGCLFFVFMSFAALSTIIAVFENIISIGMDLFNWSRKKAVIINLVLIFALSLPCALGFNLLSGIQPFGAGSTIQDLEDFLVTYNFLPLGSLAYLFFCTSRYGWGFDGFLSEANSGSGIRFPGWTRIYLKFVLPCIVIFIFIQGYWTFFC
ncbi:sodium-dependent transporter [[Clostridium] spiroforme]|nr:sodium-dependent transporter [Thomasclavelia spiroformis]MBM6880806.1 sodium-dependent transporter [Thomasclavelia spiroformis]